MEANLPPKQAFPYSTWGPAAALFGVVLALVVGIILGIPAVIIDHPKSEGDLSSTANAFVQFATALGFLIVPIVMASRGGVPLREALGRLGVRRFEVPSAFLWMFVAVVAYLAIAIVYANVIGEPKQKDIAESFGTLPVQILLIVVVAPVSEEVCFRGMLYGGLREKLPRFAAALIGGLIFGGLHVLTGLSAVPPLMVFGVVLCLLYEKTGAIWPGIMLHMLNNTFALLGQ
jgi:membrane protease YdiL (CAAX protease family)